MALRHPVRLRSVCVAASFLFLAFISGGCASVQSSFSGSKTPQGVAVVVTPSQTTITVASTQKFSATVTNTSNTAVVWQVNGVTGGEGTHGTIDATGLYQAPATVPTPAVVSITAISEAQSNKSGTAQATLVAPAAISVAISPASASVEQGHSQTLTATVQNDSQNKGLSWTLSGAGCSGATCGTLSSTTSGSGAAVTYTAPATVPNPATVTAAATSVADGTKLAASTLTITASSTAAISVAMSPTSASVQTGQTHSITATLQNDTQNKGVSWTLSGSGCSGAACGTLSASASASGTAITYTAPSSVPSPATVTLTAKSVADTTKTAATTITVTSATPPAISVVVNPTSASVQTGHTHSVTATVQNDSQNKGVTWALSGAGCSGATCGTLSATTSASETAITYTAPASVPSPATVTLTAKSVADATKTAAVTLTISSTTPPAIVVAVSPTSVSVQTGQAHSITATVQNDTQNKGVTWALSGAGCSGATCGTLSAATSASGTAITYTAPSSVPNPATVTLTAKSVADTTKTAAATLTITNATPPAIVVAVNPTSTSVQTGQTHSITATLQNDSQNKGVTWTLSGAGCSGAACGTLSAATSASGTAITFTAPSTVPNPATLTLTAKSVADGTKTAATTITITSTTPPAISVSVNPTTASVQTGQTHNITATVQNDAQNKGVTWTLSGAGCSGTACGTLSTAASASGVAITYTAPASVPSPATVTLTAKSVADATKTASTTITIASVTPPAISVSVNPTTASVQTGQTHSITATVQNDAQSKGVMWTLSGAGCSGAACGTLSTTSSASGTAITYTAPASVPSPATVALTARSVTDTTKSATATFTITAVITGSVKVTIIPKRTALTTRQQQTFTATVSGSSNAAVVWEVDSITGGNGAVGTVSGSGVYSPPSGPGTHTVTARSVADTTASASASVGITDLAGVYTYHNDLSRDGVNAREYALNTSTVNSTTFGKVFACAIDAAAYAQPLWVANISIGGGTHNVLIAATQHDTVYAFDADAAPCQTYWSKSLLGGGETWGNSNDVNSDDINPNIGITGTPVIDPSTNTIYVVSKSKAGSTFHQRLHALNLADGSEKFNGPREIAFTSGNLSFNPLKENQRAGLALANGVVYVAYASHGDNPTYYGWVVGYSAGSLAQVSLFNDNPKGSFGGIWMSGAAPAADSNGNLYVITGNGIFDGVTEFGDSFLRLSTNNGISVGDFFTPSNQLSLNATDGDLGAGGAAILVDLPTGNQKHLLIGGGKQGILYLLNRDKLGGNTDDDSGAVQRLSLGKSIFSTAAFWQNTMYIGPVQSPIRAYPLNTNGPSFNNGPSSQGNRSFGYPGSTPAISAQGTSNGIVWAIENNGTALLHAYDATNLGNELWNSSDSGTGQAVKFTVPTIANGKAYMGTATEISVYGLLPN